MMKKILQFWPLFVILGIWFLFASPYFLKGFVPYASTYQVNFFPPWSYYGELAGPIKNNAMPDVHSQIYPWKKLTVDTYQSGQIPLWNPYSFSGNPHMANFQSAVYSPFNLLFFALPFIHAWSLLVLLQPLLAGVFMYLFARSYKISMLGSIISATAFMFCGFLVVWMAYGTLAYAIIYLPLAFYGIESFSRSRRWYYLILFILTIPLSFFSGHFQISLYFFGASLAFVLYKGFTEKLSKTFWYLIAGSVFGLIISCIQLLPSFELYANSIRSSIFLLSETIPFNYVITAVAPDFFGNPVTRNDWFGHYAEWASFVGVLPLLLAFYIAFSRQKKSLFFTLLALSSLVLAVKSPLSEVIVALKLPVISTSALSRIIVLFSFSVAVLAGMGLDEFKNRIESEKRKKPVITHLLFGGLFAIVWILLFVFNLLPNDKLIIAKRNFIVPSLVFSAASGLVFLGFLLYPKWKIQKISRNFLLFLLMFCLVGISSADSFLFAKKWMPFDPIQKVYPDIPLTAAIQREIGNGRIFGNIGGEFTTYYKIPSLEGYDPLFLDRYGQLLRSANHGTFEESERSVVRLSRRGQYVDRVLDVLGVSVIFHPLADTNQGWAYPVWKYPKRFTVVYADGRFQLFKNNTRFQRAQLFYNYEVVPDSKKMIQRFYSPKFDFRNILLLEENPGIKSSQNASGSANIASYTPNKVTIEVKTNTSALVFLSDNYYPGWKAYVNGKETKIYRADYTFRAVSVPKGNSKVIFEYKIFY